MEGNVIALTHVCQRWRDIIIAHSKLWARLNCTNTEKTRVFIERSRSSPLEIVLYEKGRTNYLQEAFSLVIPHIDRVISLHVSGGVGVLKTLTKYFSRPVPLLRDFDINLGLCDPHPVLNDTLFDGDLSSLCILSLTGVIPRLPCSNLSKLNIFSLRNVDDNKISVTRLLDLFANAHLLSKVDLVYSVPASSDAPPERVVHLPCLQYLTVLGGSGPPLIILNHLSVPPKASLHLEGDFGIGNSLRNFLPTNPQNLQNLSSFTSICLNLDKTDISMKLEGPRVGLYLHRFKRPSTATVSDCGILRSLSCFPLSRIQSLAVTTYKPLVPEEIDKSSSHHILCATKDLRTLFVNKCTHLLFIDALNPNQNPCEPPPCPKLEHLILYIGQDALDVRGLVEMARERELRGVRLQSITVIVSCVRLPEGEVLELREYVASVRCKSEWGQPDWDEIPDYGGN